MPLHGAVGAELRHPTPLILMSPVDHNPQLAALISSLPPSIFPAHLHTIHNFLHLPSDRWRKKLLCALILVP